MMRAAGPEARYAVYGPDARFVVHRVDPGHSYALCSFWARLGWLDVRDGPIRGHRSCPRCVAVVVRREEMGQ